MNHPGAKILKDSISPLGSRLTTMEVTCHRFVLAEFNTHRVFSRNSASSRAIPVQKQLDRVKESPAYPESWPAEQPGMQGGEDLTGADLELAQSFYNFMHEKVWREVEAYLKITEGGPRLHKSVVNRFLEPFMWHTIVVSSTSWDNFFKQRCSPLAQPEIKVVAELMRDALNNSTPAEVDFGSWHTPYDEDLLGFDQNDIIKISTARCTRVSYLNHGTGVKDTIQDLRLYNDLISADPMHASPLEHPATPARIGEPVYGNFSNWHQWRSFVQNPQDTLS